MTTPDIRKIGLILGGILVLVALGGCGGGGGNTVAGSGSLTLRVKWPSNRSNSRLIPQAANSIVVKLVQNGTVVASTNPPITRPQSSYQFSNVPAKLTTMEAAAYPTTNGTGVAEAQGSVQLQIKPQTDNQAPTLTMASTITAISITPSQASVSLGGTVSLAAAATDSSGDVVMVAPSVLQWSSSNTSVASVNSSGTVQGVAPGTATITVLDTESGKSGTAAIYTTAATTTLPVITWTPIGPSNIIPNGGGPASGKLQALAVYNANPQIIYVGGGLGSGNEGPSSDAGAFVSTDGGSTWQTIDNGLTDRFVDALWVDQANSDHVLAGAEGGEIFQTTNGGQQWTQVAGFPTRGEQGGTNAFAQLGSSVLAATAQGVAESSDGGTTWSVIEPTSSPVYAIDAIGRDIVAGLASGDVILSTNSGASWQPIFSSSNHNIWGVAIDRTNGNDLYVIIGPEPSALYVSTNGGGSWTNVSLPGGQQNVQAVAASAATADLVYVAGGGWLYSTTTAGSSWTQVPGAVWDNRAILPGTSAGTIYLGSDQGVYGTQNGGGSWSCLSAPVKSSLLFSVAVNGSTILTAAQDFNPIVSYDGGSTWQQLSGSKPPVGEAGTVWINPGNTSYCYAYTTAGYQYSQDGGKTFTVLSVLHGITYVQPGGTNIVAVDPQNPATVYAAAQSGVYKSTTWGASMSNAGWPFMNTTAVAVAPNNSSTIFVGTTSGLSVTHDGGSTWTHVPLNASGYPATIAIDPNNPQNVLIGLSNAQWSGGGVVRSTDGGATFSPANTGLSRQSPPSGYGYDVRDIVFDSSVPGLVALAISNGLYLSSDSGASWVNETNNAIPIFFTGVWWDGGYLYASTFGEGMLRSSSKVAVQGARRVR